MRVEGKRLFATPAHYPGIPPKGVFALLIGHFIAATFAPGVVGTYLEAYSLVQLKDHLLDPTNALESWRLDRKPFLCTDWHGISCNNDDRVTNISLPNAHLGGTLPDVFKGIEFLELLVLSSNSLYGSFPNLLGCEHLKVLRLNNNRLGGVLPFESHSEWASPLGKSIEIIDLEGNDLIGELGSGSPEILANSPLREFRVGGNKLSGPLPKGLEGFRELQTLDLADNDFTGTIPEEWGNFQSLQTLDVSGNDGLCGDEDHLESIKNVHVSDTNVGKACQQEIPAPAPKEEPPAAPPPEVMEGGMAQPPGGQSQNEGNEAPAPQPSDMDGEPQDAPSQTPNQSPAPSQDEESEAETPEMMDGGMGGQSQNGGNGASPPEPSDMDEEPQGTPAEAPTQSPNPPNDGTSRRGPNGPPPGPSPSQSQPPNQIPPTSPSPGQSPPPGQSPSPGPLPPNQPPPDQSPFPAPDPNPTPPDQPGEEPSEPDQPSGPSRPRIPIIILPRPRPPRDPPTNEEPNNPPEAPPQQESPPPGPNGTPPGTPPTSPPTNLPSPPLSPLPPTDMPENPTASPRPLPPPPLPVNPSPPNSPPPLLPQPTPILPDNRLNRDNEDSLQSTGNSILDGVPVVGNAGVGGIFAVVILGILVSLAVAGMVYRGWKMCAPLPVGSPRIFNIRNNAMAYIQSFEPG